jgi:hypothetical protein
MKILNIAVMSVHSINSSAQNQPLQLSSRVTNKTIATDVVASTVANTKLDDVWQISKTAKDINAASISSNTDQKFDFTNMTPRQMKGVANELFKQGKIDIDQLFQLETAGVPLGKQGAHGEFVELTSAEKESYMNKPVNYIKHTADCINFLEQTGYANDPKSGYEMMRNLLGKLKAGLV